MTTSQRDVAPTHSDTSFQPTAPSSSSRRCSSAATRCFPHHRHEPRNLTSEPCTPSGAHACSAAPLTTKRLRAMRRTVARERERGPRVVGFFLARAGRRGTPTSHAISSRTCQYCSKSALQGTSRTARSPRREACVRRALEHFRCRCVRGGVASAAFCAQGHSPEGGRPSLANEACGHRPLSGPSLRDRSSTAVVPPFLRSACRLLYSCTQVNSRRDGLVVTLSAPRLADGQRAMPARSRLGPWRWADRGALGRWMWAHAGPQK